MISCRSRAISFFSGVWRTAALRGWRQRCGGVAGSAGRGGRFHRAGGARRGRRDACAPARSVRAGGHAWPARRRDGRARHPERVGYLLKERVFDVATLVDALRRIAGGETVVDPTIVSRLVGRRRRADPLAELTHREREVLGLVAQELSNKGDRGKALCDRTDSRGARKADLPQAPARREPRVAASRARSARVPSRSRVADPCTGLSAAGDEQAHDPHPIALSGEVAILN